MNGPIRGRISRTNKAGELNERKPLEDKDMRAERPLIVSVVLLAAGLGLIFGYCHGSVGIGVASPMSASSFEIATKTTGPGALGGPALTALGVLALLWAALAAVVNQVRELFAGLRARQGRDGDQAPRQTN